MASTVRVCSAFLLATFAAAIIGGCNNGSGAASGGSASGTAETNGTLSISGIPALSVAAGGTYTFRPTASDVGAAAFTFAIKNQPAWSQFDAATGTLSGIPIPANIGSYSEIQISVSNGAVTAALPAFSINVVPTGSVSALAISGDPALLAVTGAAYSFHPTVTAPAGAVLAYTVKNLPSWAAFDPDTGALSGTPAAADAGSTAQILITVSDGTASATLAGFSIDLIQATSGVADLSWTAPVPSTSDSANANELVGYHIYYGTSSTNLTHVVNVSNPDSTNFVIDHLASGAWYFAIKSYDDRNVESSLSAIVPVSIG